VRVTDIGIESVDDYADYRTGQRRTYWLMEFCFGTVECLYHKLRKNKVDLTVACKFNAPVVK
jgi:hypothetical protein